MPIKARKSILFYRIIPGPKTFWDRVAEHQEWFIRQIEEDEATNHHKLADDEYRRAWIAYVTVVWQRVQQLRREGTQALLDARVARPEPEVPDHLVNETEPRS